MYKNRCPRVFLFRVKSSVLVSDVEQIFDLQLDGHEATLLAVVEVDRSGRVGRRLCRNHERVAVTKLEGNGVRLRVFPGLAPASTSGGSCGEIERRAVEGQSNFVGFRHPHCGSVKRGGGVELGRDERQAPGWLGGRGGGLHPGFTATPGRQGRLLGLCNIKFCARWGSALRHFQSDDTFS